MRSSAGAALAEFGPALCILLVVVVPALLAMLSLLDGATTLYFTTSAAARSAAPATTFEQAKANAADAAQQILGGPLGGLARIAPRDGSGIKIEIQQVDKSGQSAGEFAPPVDTDKYFYQYQISTPGYKVSPVFWPGSPIPLNFKASCHVEHPEGLTQ